MLRTAEQIFGPQGVEKVTQRDKKNERAQTNKEVSQQNKPVRDYVSPKLYHKCNTSDQNEDPKE